MRAFMRDGTDKKMNIGEMGSAYQQSRLKD
jgi:hypothetical protein